MIIGQHNPPPLRIRCMQCDKPVDRIDVWNACGEKSVVVKVHCHGDTEQMEITPHMLQHRQAVEQIHAQEGQAFTTKRIATNEK